MFIAKKKRRENMAEYILYLWQIEDMLRALEFSAEKIYQNLVEPHTELNEEQKQQAFFWYMDMVNLLTTEGKREQGHLDHTMHLIADLNDLHLMLLKNQLGQEKGYVGLFSVLAPELPKLKGDKNDQMSDMEACFRALYSVMLCRMKPDGGIGTENYVRDVLELVSPVVAKLAAIYRAVEEGEVDLYKK